MSDQIPSEPQGDLWSPPKRSKQSAKPQESPSSGGTVNPEHLRTRREAVRQKIGTMGIDSDNEHYKASLGGAYGRKRRAEKAATHNDQAELLGTDARTRLAAGGQNPYTSFLAKAERAVDECITVDDEQRLARWANAHDVWFRDVGGRMQIEATVDGQVFRASAGSLKQALSHLCFNMREVVEQRVEVETPPASAAESQRRNLPKRIAPAAETVYRYFLRRNQAIAKFRESDLDVSRQMTITDVDREMAALVGVHHQDYDSFPDLARQVMSLVQPQVDDTLYYGLTKEAMPGEDLERKLAQESKRLDYLENRWTPEGSNRRTPRKI